MNRCLHWINLMGVLALAGLCAAQWRENRRLHLQSLHHQRRQIEQSAQLTAQAKAAQGQAEDLASLQAALSRLDGDLKKTAAQLASAEKALRMAQAERDQLKESITNWVAAVASRDERLSHAGQRLKAIAAERDSAAKQFNDLAEKHNQLVREWNALQAQHGGQTQTGPGADRPRPSAP